MARPPVIVVEDDPFTRLIPIVLDPTSPDGAPRRVRRLHGARRAGFRRLGARVRDGRAGLYPAEVRMVTSQDEMRADLKDARALVVESLQRRPRTISRRRATLKAVQKFGTGLRNIDTAACAEKGIKVLTLRRRANISCAEHAFGLMLMLARKLDDAQTASSRADADQGGRTRCRPFDRRHTPGGNYPAPRRHARAQRCDHRHHWPRRDRTRDCAARPGLRHARALPSAHPRAGEPRSAS